MDQQQTAAPKDQPATPGVSSFSDPLGTPGQRRNVWLSIAGICVTDGRFDWAKQAQAFAAMDDPPREWPSDSEPARMLRGEAIPGVPAHYRFAGWLTDRPSAIACYIRRSPFLTCFLGAVAGWLFAEYVL